MLDETLPVWFGADDVREWLEQQLPGWTLQFGCCPYHDKVSDSMLFIHRQSGVCLWVFRSRGKWNLRTIPERYWRYGQSCVKHRSASVAVIYAKKMAQRMAVAA